MSIPVALEKLRTETMRFGAAPYLLTTSDDGRPHAVLVTIAWVGDSLVAKTGARGSANAAARPLVSLLWAPFEPGGYSLIVDGEGTVSRNGDDTRVIMRPTRGVLHRPAIAHQATRTGCSADCIPLLG